MPNRREVVLGGLAGSALAAAPRLLRAAGAACPADLPAAPCRIVVDERYAAPRALAEAALARGWAVSANRGDVTSLWYDDLALRWRTHPMPIAGMTTVSALFCLERLAVDAGLRLNLRIDHRGYRDGRVMHTLAAPPGLLAHRDAQILARTDLAAALPPLLARATHAPRGLPEERVYAGAPGALALTTGEWLVSWSIGTRAARMNTRLESDG